MLVFGRLLEAGKGREQQVVHPEPPGGAARPRVFQERAPYLSSPFILRQCPGLLPTPGQPPALALGGRGSRMHLRPLEEISLWKTFLMVQAVHSGRAGCLWRGELPVPEKQK